MIIPEQNANQSSFQLTVDKTKSVRTIVTKKNIIVSQSELIIKTEKRLKARENADDQATIGIRFMSTPIKERGKPQTIFAFDTRLKIALIIHFVL